MALTFEAPPNTALTPAPRIQMLEEAIKLTSGDRNEVYGNPATNHEHIAKVFNAITGRNLSAYEIALIHVATKIARLAKAPYHKDSYVDLMAYAGIAFECQAYSETSDPERPAT